MNNTVTLQGNLAGVEALTSKSGTPYVKAGVLMAKDENGNARAYPFTAFGKAAEALQGFKEGDPVSVAGRLDRSDYSDQNGDPHASFSIIGGKVEEGKAGEYKSAFSLSGFVVTPKGKDELEVKRGANGTEYLNYGLSVKRDTATKEGEKAKYDTFFLTAFGANAKKMGKYKKSDLVKVSGTIDVDENGKISPIARSGEMIREASTMQADKAADNTPQKEQTNDRGGRA